MTKEHGYTTVVRIMGKGQFKVNEETIRDINKVDNTIVEILQNENKADNQEFKTNIANLVQTIISKGQRLDDKELVESDVIVPDSDISLEEAKKVFRGEGIIPDL